MILKFHRISVTTKFTFESPVFLSGMKEYDLSSNPTLLIIEYGFQDWVNLILEEMQMTRLLLLNRLSWVHCLSHRMLLPGHHLNMRTVPSNYIEYDFVPSGSVQLFNPRLPTDLEVIPNNSLVIESKTIRVGLGTTVRFWTIAVN